MATDLPSDRRSFLKWAAALPLLGQIAARDLLGRALRVAGKEENVYARLGVRTLINARGTWTYLSGSLELPEVQKAQSEAAKHFVDVFELQHAVGRRLAELSGAESGMVTSGAAGAMASATAACIAGTDPVKIWQLPDTTGLKHEVIMAGGRSPFDSAVRLAGGKLVLVESHEQIPSAINGNTAMIYTTDLGEKLEKEVSIARAARIPLLLDDAAGIPPIENLRLYARMGVDLYTFSGGKGLGGPQCSGLLLGRRDLIEAALANTSPWEGAVCRAMKVGKEEIMGCLAAVEAWMKMDLSTLNRQWNERVEKIARLVKTVPGVTTDIRVPQEGNRYPTLTVKWDERAWGFSVVDCARQLRDGDPRIEVLTTDNPSGVAAAHPGIPSAKTPREPDQLQIVSMTLQAGEELVVGRRLREILSTARKSAVGLLALLVLIGGIPPGQNSRLALGTPTPIAAGSPEELRGASQQRLPQQDTEPTEAAPSSPLSKKQKKDLLKDNFAKMKRDADRLAELANSLQEDLNKSNENVLSLSVVEKAGRIEKLAKKIKDTARGY